MSTGSAFGAVSILNATATGQGCSLAVEAGCTATWEWDGDDLEAHTGTDDALARAVWQLARARRTGATGARVRTTSALPPSRGLKTSSSSSGAMLRAATGESDWQGLAEACVEASIAAGVTLTGAFDDQVAVLRGGAHLTDNRALRVLESFAPPRWHVAIWVPEQVIAKASLRGLDASRLRDYVAVPRSAQQLPEAMTQNGRAFHAFYAAHGLPVSDAPARVALDAGALGAGLSGTGPAVAAIFDEPADLPAVAGGEWLWTRVAR